MPQRENQTVLDVVTWVQRNADPTLAYRFACRVGMCGSCAMTVNGRPRWTCRTHISKVVEDGRLEIGPLANLPVIKDLACDMAAFFEKWQEAKGVFAPSKTRHDADRDDLAGERAAHRRRRRHRVHQLRRVLLGLRYGALERGLSGPGRAQPRLDARQRRARRRQPRSASPRVAASGGCHACHSHQSCQEHCPKALNPTASIAGLKRRTMQAYIRGEL